jgi:hypothetical protein
VLRFASGFFPTRPHGARAGVSRRHLPACSCLRLAVATNSPREGLSPPIQCPCQAHPRPPSLTTGPSVAAAVRSISFMLNFTMAGSSGKGVSKKAGGSSAAARVSLTRHAGRNLPAVWPAELPLRQWARARPEALSLHQSTRQATSSGLCAQWPAGAGRGADRQLPQTARHAGRDLCHQHGTAAPARGAGVASHEPGAHRVRHHPARRHYRRHGGCLPRRRRSARSGGGAR